MATRRGVARSPAQQVQSARLAALNKQRRNTPMTEVHKWRIMRAHSRRWSRWHARDAAELTNASD